MKKSRTCNLKQMRRIKAHLDEEMFEHSRKSGLRKKVKWNLLH